MSDDSYTRLITWQERAGHAEAELVRLAGRIIELEAALREMTDCPLCRVHPEHEEKARAALAESNWCKRP